jgi:DNA repair protein RadA/Sms
MQLNHTKVGFTKIGEVEIPDNFFNRIKTGISDIDMIFGDGILPGSVTTLISDPGVGKSIFCRTILDKLQSAGYNVGYASGEEDINQIAYSSLTLGITDLQTATITDVDILVSAMDEFDVLVIDSFQTLTTTKDLNSRAHVQYLTNTIVHNAKKRNCAVIVIVQKTSSGEIKGGTTLPFAVDLNIRILKDADMGESFRLVEVYKNRFGKTGKYELEMTDSGYVFKGVYIEPEAPEKAPRIPVSNVRKDIIMGMIEPPLITIERVMDELNVAHQTASNLLRELTSEKRLIKYGRGSDAVWKMRVPIQIKSDETEQSQEHGAAVFNS